GVSFAGVFYAFPTRRSSDLRDQVVALEHLGVLADVDQRRERLRVPGVVDVVEVDDREVVIGVGTRESGRAAVVGPCRAHRVLLEDRKSTRLNSSHGSISYAV